MSPREMSLHSTMFLLIRNRATKIRNYNPALHSTMFLLIQFDILTQKIKRAVFTFHDVSINTLITFFQPCYKSTLHSTMFLLIRKWQKQLTQTLMTLHSTMFLLIRKNQRNTHCRDFCFTFHDVSINTTASVLSRFYSFIFTFHDVSINTRRLFILTIQI